MSKIPIIAVTLVAALLSPLSAFAQGSAGTGSTSTGIGAPAGPAVAVAPLCPTSCEGDSLETAHVPL
jgi:hypothetical protein